MNIPNANDDVTEDLLVQSKDLPWSTMGEGVSIKILRVSEETGFWSSMIRMEPGSQFAPHKHLGAAEFYVLKGALDYRGGRASEGCYGYEPLGAVHEATTCDVETIITFNSYGPVVFYDENGSVVQILSYETARDLAAGAASSLTVEKEKPAA